MPVGICNMIYAYDPKIIVIGGLLSEMGETVLTPVKENLERLLPELIWKRLRIELTVLGSRASLVGAAQAGFRAIFSSPISGDSHSGRLCCIGTGT